MNILAHEIQGLTPIQCEGSAYHIGNIGPTGVDDEFMKSLAPLFNIEILDNDTPFSQQATTPNWLYPFRNNAGPHHHAMSAQHSDTLP